MARQIGDRILMTWSETGERQVLCEPKGRKENANFLILWSGRDWSGFQTFDEVMATATSIERQTSCPSRYLFDVVERL
jgi:hypothetical protein